MKYKIEDKIKIKKALYHQVVQIDLDRLPDRIATIGYAGDGIYYMYEIAFPWYEHDIECLVENYIEPEPITNRFEILDL